MLEVLINHFSDGNKAQFALRLGIKPQTLSMWFLRNSFDAELIHTKCEGVSGDWLLSGGEGEMLLTGKNTTKNEVRTQGDFSPAAMNGNVSIEASAILKERINSLEALLSEKERVIKIYEKMMEK